MTEEERLTEMLIVTKKGIDGLVMANAVYLDDIRPALRSISSGI